MHRPSFMRARGGTHTRRLLGLAWMTRRLAGRVAWKGNAMMCTAGGRAGKTIKLAGVFALLSVLAASGCMGPDAGEPGAALAAQGTDSLRAKSAAKVSVCHRAERRWVPLTLPEAAVQSHVSRHGDFVYDTSAGQCCTDADCAAGQPCRLVLGPDGQSLIGVCRVAAGAGPDSRGLLLAVSLFGPASGATFPFTGVLSRDATDNYFLSFTLNGINAQVPLASFILDSGTPFAENSPTPVTVTFPGRNSGLIAFDGTTNYLNVTVTASSFSGAGTVNLDNAVVAGFSLDSPYGVVFLDSGDSYSILGIRGVYVLPTSPIGNGNGNAGFYPGLLNGSISANVLVFKGAVYDVRL